MEPYCGAGDKQRPSKGEERSLGQKAGPLPMSPVGLTRGRGGAENRLPDGEGFCRPRQEGLGELPWTPPTLIPDFASGS